MSLTNRAKIINAKPSELRAKVYLYPIEQGGKIKPAKPGYGCPCFADKKMSEPGWDGWMQLGNDELVPGETRTVGFCFLSGLAAVKALSKRKLFYLWDGKIIGEATIVNLL